MRLALYGGISSLLAIGVILNAVLQRANFYAACVYLSKSSACIMVLMNMGMLLVIGLGKILQAVFFGSLRAIEVEHLYERSWYAVTETCLAMTIFREEFNLQFIIVFTTLLFLKIFHWLCQDRVDYMEQSPSHQVSFHVRMVNLMALLFIIDVVLAQYAISVTMVKGPNMMVMFGFEYAILICTVLSTVGKYVINVVDMRSEEQWEGKSMYVIYLDILTDFFKLVTYLIFFCIICYYYQLPLHIIRDVYVTFRSFIQKCRDLYRYRRATRNMNDLYPTATEQDFARNDTTCIICREDMRLDDQGSTGGDARQRQQQQFLNQPKKLRCGHIFHFHCLRSWLERQQSCPTCRRSVLNDTPITDDQQQAAQQQQQQQPQDPQQQQQQTPPDGAQEPHQGGDPGQAPLPPPPFSSFTHDPAFQQTHQTHQPQQTQSTFASPYVFQHPPPSTSSPLSFSGGPVPGLIPLVPLSALPNNNTHTQHRSELPLELSDEQLSSLSTLTREGIVQRLKILEAVQNQTFQIMQVLTQALSVLPGATPPPQTAPSSHTRSQPADMAQATAATRADSTHPREEETDGPTNELVPQTESSAGNPSSAQEGSGGSGNNGSSSSSSSSIHPYQSKGKSPDLRQRRWQSPSLDSSDDEE
ncbi:hypothetical protein BCR43DRAFT_455635 [Syncephalastrum racemosum]|uniref:RING-type E3 ubiquitin transferase n=1 Tax=Syncephalastrum racemosum TaxID=13706 RepID=A0A1X2HJ75_SYNRA|nr:hypothetical protein BCR43DRAFT_455635 [Syncephalastrum racemosum]